MELEIHSTEEEINDLADRILQAKEHGIAIGEAAFLTSLLSIGGFDYASQRGEFTEDIPGSQVTARIAAEDNKLYLAFFNTRNINTGNKYLVMVIEIEDKTAVEALRKYYKKGE